MGFNRLISKFLGLYCEPSRCCCRKDLNKKKKVCLIDELDDLDIEYFGDPVENHHDGKTAFIYDLNLEEELEDVGAVIVGYEHYFNYIKLMKAANYLKDEHCLFVATNQDETCPGPNPSTVIPDAGPIVAAVQKASGRTPIVVGKPNTPAFEYICLRWKINPQRTMMVGDRTDTDIKFGKVHGMKACFVLSGCHQIGDILENQANGIYDMVTNYYAKNLGSLVPEDFLSKSEVPEKIIMGKKLFVPQPVPNTC
ncbi:hypothetical protein L596_012218 [Steinernema carpocapsae]|uniref:Phosphoglycolate phosphatase n=1 Tax=Steinernema carpocapsae TaxID=34508 RepID=A0A4U5NWL8_STECR|nr:hypothetical protein L596_012218 [Steinernema carpocapsae]